MKDLLVILGILTAFPVWAWDVIEVKLKDVRPTQAVVGFQWVEHKVDKFDDYSGKELRKRLKEDPSPAVYGPGGVVYILDNHHEFRALMEMGVEEAYVEIWKDYSDLSMNEFERKMIKQGWVYFGNSQGQTVYTMETLPQSLSGLKNDPYRTLASMLRRAGGFKKTGDTHQEFQWANALRPLVSPQLIAQHPERAVEIALEFAWSSAAKDLPGFRESKSRCEQALQRQERP